MDIILTGHRELSVNPEVRSLGDFILTHPEHLPLVSDVLLECKSEAHFNAHIADPGSAFYVYGGLNPEQRNELRDRLIRFFTGSEEVVKDRRSQFVEYLTSQILPLQSGLRPSEQRYHSRVLNAQSREPVIKGDDHNFDVALVGTKGQVYGFEGYECKAKLDSIFYLKESRMRTSDHRKLKFMLAVGPYLRSKQFDTLIAYITLGKSVHRVAHLLPDGLGKGGEIDIYVERDLRKKLRDHARSS